MKWKTSKIQHKKNTQKATMCLKNCLPYFPGMVEGKRRQGRPARRWIDDILKWCGKDLRDAASMTEDRIKWRQFVTSPCSPR